MAQHAGCTGPWSDLADIDKGFGYAVIAVIGIGGYPACAQEASVQPQWQALVTPYLWMPWTGVGVNPSRERLPSASGTVGFGQLVDHLSWVPFMGAVEFRNGDYGILLDYLHAPVRAGLNTPNILFGGAGVGGQWIPAARCFSIERLPNPINISTSERGHGVSIPPFR